MRVEPPKSRAREGRPLPLSQVEKASVWVREPGSGLIRPHVPVALTLNFQAPEPWATPSAVRQAPGPAFLSQPLRRARQWEAQLVPPNRWRLDIAGPAPLLCARLQPRSPPSAVSDAPPESLAASLRAARGATCGPGCSPGAAGGGPGQAGESS